jgi:monoamine oxidase
VHFAGEHTSLKHAWVEGALESAVRAALEVEAAAGGEEAG